MAVQNFCTICGKVCYCKKQAGVCKDCRGDRPWGSEGRLRHKRRVAKLKRDKLSG